MDEEENFARLLAQSNPAPRPTLFTNHADPWANPFGGDDLSGGWGAPQVAPARPASPPPQNPYDGGFGSGLPDPPSVIHAREREELAAFGGGFGDDPMSNPFSSSPRTSPRKSQSSQPPSPAAARRSAPSSPEAARQRTLPAGLIDEELLAENDPEASLKRAFVKHDDKPPLAIVPPTPEKKAPYVFAPSRESKPEPKPEVKPEVKEARAEAAASGSLPLPESSMPTPTPSRPDTPAAPGSAPADRVSVSPLDTPTGEPDYGFRSLAIGASSANGTSPTARFGGRGWGAVDDEPLSTSGDPWNEGAGGGWGEPGPLATQSSTASINDAEPEAEPDEEEREEPRTSQDSAKSPRRPKLLSTPVFQITISDPTKIGDPVRGHVVYTVRTKTTSPHYRRGDFSVLRRFSDFLWLYEQLTANNPGVIVPPVPDKHAFGRFQEQFIETRRAALQRCLTKITAHPILQLDPDLRLFIESDSFALDIKNRRAGAETPSTPSAGLLSSWTGPRYVEKDEWFDQRKAYLDHLEGHLKSLSKSLDLASKARLDMAVAVGDVADAAQALADSELGAAMCAALGRLADLARREKGAGEAHATADVSQLLNLSDEYVRFIGSVRLAFGSRVRAYHAWQAALKEVTRIRQVRDKARLQGRPPAQGGISMAEQAEAERRMRDTSADFEAQSKLVKAEFARFERERVDEFRRTLTANLDGQIARQRELVTAWEEYHAMLLKMVQRSQAQQAAQ
ncbi:hypothetical protein CspHIS471_0607020 [Cutaneotrichosporon sp. HIS471]|nr:hypothetical protein CspHIS471_0607020 [Cutaneotrichosporon sp. HIS471]